MASPVDAGRVATAFTAVTPWDVPLPAGIVAGDLLIAYARSGGASTLSVAPSGWTSLGGDSSDATDDTTYLYYRWATGSDVLSLTFSAAVKGAAIVWRITGAANPATQAPQRSTIQVFTTAANSGNPPAISPTGGSKDYLFITCLGVGGATTTGYAQPALYPSAVIIGSTGGSAATNCVIVAGARTATAATEDAGAWTHPAATVGGSAFTIAIHPGVVIPPTTVPNVGGPGSAQSFGTASTKAVITRAVNGADTAQAFGVTSAVIPPTSYWERVVFDGARFYWRLGEPSGITAVDTKGALDGTYTGTVVLGQPGALSGDANTSVNLNATGYVQVASDTRHQTLSNFTAEGWIYPTAAVPAGTDAAIMVHHYAGALPVALVYGTNNGTYPGRRFYGGFFSGAAWRLAVSPADLPLNAWSYCAVTYNGTTVRLYLNGVEVATLAAADWAAGPAQPLRLGTDWAANIRVPGRLDEVALYPTALSATQLRDHYKLGLSAYHKAILDHSPRAYWRLGADPTVDASGNGNTLTGSTLLRAELLPGPERGPELEPLPSGPEPRAAPSAAASLLVSDPADGSRDFSSGRFYYAADTPGISLSPPLTIEAWVFLDVLSGYQVIVRKHSSQYYVDVDPSGTIRYAYNDGAERVVTSTSSALSINTTYHVVVTDNGTTVSFYINGSLNRAVARPTATAATDTTTPLGIGAIYDGAGGSAYYFDGRIDEVALYGVVLSPAEVLAHYTIGSTPPPSPQTVSVPGLNPITAGFVLSIVGQLLVGEATVGGTGFDIRLGTPSVRTIELVPTGGVPSAQSFGTPTIRVTKQVGGVASTAAVGTPTIFAAVTKPAGGVPTAQAFGTVTPKAVIRPTVGGVATAQSFGAVTIKTATTKTVPGVGAAPAFGAVTTAKGPVTRTVGAVASAQAFGTITVGGVSAAVVTGVGSAQAFGTVTAVKLAFPQTVTVTGRATAQSFGTVTVSAGAAFPQTVPVGGRGTAQAFGTVTVKAAITKPAGGVSSAQSFGTVTFRTAVTRTVTGLGSAQQFGYVGTGGIGQVVQVPGVTPPVGMRSIVGQVISGDGHVVGGVDLRLGRPTLVPGRVTVQVGGVGSAADFGLYPPGFGQVVQVQGVQPPPEIRSIVGQVVSGDGHLVGGRNLRFGFITIRTAVTVPVVGVGSAQQFGTVWIAFDQDVAVGGVPSAARVGAPFVFKVWVRASICTDLDLAASACTDLSFAVSTYETLTLTSVGDTTLDLTPSPVEDLDLQPAGVE